MSDNSVVSETMLTRHLDDGDVFPTLFNFRIKVCGNNEENYETINTIGISR